MNKSEIAERAAREIQSECVEYSRATKAVVVNISKATKIVERAIAESRGQADMEVLEALEAIVDSARDGRPIPEWLAERLVGAEAAILKARKLGA